jgi:predicted aspartyl protease
MAVEALDKGVTRRVAVGAMAACLAAPASLLQAQPRKEQSGRPRLLEGSTSTGWRDFDFYREAMILLPGTLNGSQATIWIDSGVSGVIVDQGFAARINLNTTGAADVKAVAGTAKAATVKDLDVRIPGLVIGSAKGFIVDLSPLSRIAGQAGEVMLGRDLFETLLVDIDFPSRKIAFHDPKAFRPPAGAIPVPLRRQPNGLRTVPLSLNGGQPIQATFDLGARSAIMVSPRFAAEQGLAAAGGRSTTPTTDVGGTTVATVTTAATVQFAGLDFSQAPLVIPKVWQNDERKLAIPALLGLGLFDRFRIITDYLSDRLWLVPNEKVGRPFRKERSGLHTLKVGDRLQVIHVSEGSPAAAAGWREGEEIVSVNGVAVGETYYKSEQHKWSHGEPGASVTLGLANGSQRRLTLLDYY